MEKTKEIRFSDYGIEHASFHRNAVRYKGTVFVTLPGPPLPPPFQEKNRDKFEPIILNYYYPGLELCDRLPDIYLRDHEYLDYWYSKDRLGDVSIESLSEGTEAGKQKFENLYRAQKDCLDCFFLDAYFYFRKNRDFKTLENHWKETLLERWESEAKIWLENYLQNCRSSFLAKLRGCPERRNAWLKDHILAMLHSAIETLLKKAEKALQGNKKDFDLFFNRDRSRSDVSIVFPPLHSIAVRVLETQLKGERTNGNEVSIDTTLSDLSIELANVEDYSNFAEFMFDAKFPSFLKKAIKDKNVLRTINDILQKNQPFEEKAKALKLIFSGPGMEGFLPKLHSMLRKQHREGALLMPHLTESHFTKQNLKTIEEIMPEEDSVFKNHVPIYTGAKRFDVSSSTLYRLVRNGQIGSKKDDGLLFVSVADLKTYKKGQENYRSWLKGISEYEHCKENSAAQIMKRIIKKDVEEKRFFRNSPFSSSLWEETQAKRESTLYARTKNSKKIPSDRISDKVKKDKQGTPEKPDKLFVQRISLR